MSVSANPRVVPFLTNEQFLKTVFGSRWGEALVAYFGGDPARSADWRVYPAASVIRVMTPALNNYWDVSLPRPGGRRTGQDFEAIYAIVLDDYAVKVDADKVKKLLGCAPSYIIETSPRNYHAGWFVEPLSDRAWVWGLLRGLYRALDNTGDNLVKPTTLVRLPVGTNSKAALGPGGFRVRLVEWSPDTRIKHTDWIDIEARIGAVTPINPRLDLDNAMPDPAEIEDDLVLKTLRSRGMVLDLGRQMTFGWGFEIECPWAGDHSDPRTSASYVPVKGRFKCHHGHCEGRTMGDLREWTDRVIKEDSGGLESLASQEFDDGSPPPPGVSGETAVGRALASYEATEDGLARAFADRHEHLLRFDHVRGVWFRWNGWFWRRDETRCAFDWARDLVREFRLSLVDVTPGQIRAWGKMGVPAAIEQATRADRKLATDGLEWDHEPWLVGAPGCEIDLKTGLVLTADPRHQITKQLLLAPENIPTPIWDQFLWETTGGDHSVIEFLQGWAGYNMTGDTSEEKFGFFFGPGGNGKGTFLYTVSAILNDYAARCQADTFMVRKYDAHPEEIARLAGVRAVAASDIENGRTFNVGRLKDFTGRDGKLTGRFMRQNTFEFTPQFKITFVGNNQPRLPNVDAALRRRLILVPFTQKPAVADTTLKDRLVPEYPGILRWMIEGEQNRQAAGGLSALIPAAAVAATEEYLDAQDPLKVWAGERCGFGYDKQMGVLEALDDYKSWGFAQGETIDADKQSFSRKFTDLFPVCRVQRMVKGMTILGAEILSV